MSVSVCHWFPAFLAFVSFTQDKICLGVNINQSHISDIHSCKLSQGSLMQKTSNKQSQPTNSNSYQLTLSLCLLQKIKQIKLKVRKILQFFTKHSWVLWCFIAVSNFAYMQASWATAGVEILVIAALTMMVKQKKWAKSVFCYHWACKLSVWAVYTIRTYDSDILLNAGQTWKCSFTGLGCHMIFQHGYI